MGKFIDLTGQRFGRLEVIDFAGYKKRADGHNAGYWRCVCTCGRETFVSARNLNSGAVKSCGCLRLDKFKECRTVHGASPKYEKKDRLYIIWTGMKQRCYNHSHKNYTDYGGRGITVCDEWLHDFSAFQKWAMAHGYADDLTIDRIDNDKGYSPDNCRWDTIKEQRKNQRPRSRKKKGETE